MKSISGSNAVEVTKDCNSDDEVVNDYIVNYYEDVNLSSEKSNKDKSCLDRGMTTIKLASENTSKLHKGKEEDGMDGQKDDGGRGRKVVRQRAYLVKGEEEMRRLLDSGAK